jgi:hypothetical protein
MSDRILSKYASRGEETPVDGVVDEGDEAENHGCFGWARGVRERSPSLELHRKNGHILAVNYAFIHKFEFEPSLGIIIHIGNGNTIKIKGRNLNAEQRPGVRLFSGITRFRVPWVMEQARAETFSPGSKTAIIEAITW